MREEQPIGKEKSPITSHVGSVLRDIRLMLGKCLKEVADAAGITHVTLHKLETGKSSSRSDTYERVAKALGADYEHVVRLAKRRHAAAAGGECGPATLQTRPANTAPTSRTSGRRKGRSG